MKSDENVTAKTGLITKIASIASLLALAGVIFILLTNRQHLSGPLDKTAAKSSDQTQKGIAGGTRMAFVMADSVQNNYLMTIHFLDSIEKRFRSMEGDLMRKKQSYQKRVNTYYHDAQSGLLPESTAQKIERNLEKEGSEIAELEENYAGRINDLQLKLNIIYFDSLWNFLERRKEEMGFDMVVGYQQGLTNIFFADHTINITDQVIELLNKEYIEKYPLRKNLKKKVK